jgi:hypothetical protein
LLYQDPDASGVFGLTDPRIAYDDPLWTALNAEQGFAYSGGGVHHRHATAFISGGERVLAGFLNEYSMSAVEEDKAEVFAALMRRGSKLLAVTDKALVRKAEELQRRLGLFDADMGPAFWTALHALPPLRSLGAEAWGGGGRDGGGGNGSLGAHIAIEIGQHRSNPGPNVNSDCDENGSDEGASTSTNDDEAASRPLCPQPHAAGSSGVAVDPATDVGVWEKRTYRSAATDPSGPRELPYWYNATTNQSSWINPELSSL